MSNKKNNQVAEQSIAERLYAIFREYEKQKLSERIKMGQKRAKEMRMKLVKK